MPESSKQMKELIVLKLTRKKRTLKTTEELTNFKQKYQQQKRGPETGQVNH